MKILKGKNKELIRSSRLILLTLSGLFTFALPCFSQPATSYDVQLIRIPQSWTDSTRTDQLIVTVQSYQQIDTLFISGSSDRIAAQVIYRIPLQSDKVFSSYKSLITLKNTDSLHVSSASGRNIRLFYYKVPISRNPYGDVAVPISMRMLRADLRVSKLPSNHFSKEDTVLFEYVIRLPDSLKNDRYGYQLLIQSSLADTIVHTFKHLQEGGFLTISGQVPALRFGSGRHVIQTQLYRNNVGFTAVSSLPFFVLLSPSDSTTYARRNPGVNTQSSLFSSYSENELDLLFDQAQYIALPDEITLYRRLTSLSQKQAFMETFWSNRATDPSNNLISYTEKVTYANKVYRGGGKEGYLTDRGKVYLKYGSCDDIYVSTSEVNVKPFEVWYYPEVKGQSSVYFYFVDLSGYGNYQLIHSTARDEVYNLQYLIRLGINPSNYREQ